MVHNTRLVFIADHFSDIDTVSRLPKTTVPRLLFDCHYLSVFLFLCHSDSSGRFSTSIPDIFDPMTSFVHPESGERLFVSLSELLSPSTSCTLTDCNWGQGGQSMMSFGNWTSLSVSLIFSNYSLVSEPPFLIAFHQFIAVRIHIWQVCRNSVENATSYPHSVSLSPSHLHTLMCFPCLHLDSNFRYSHREILRTMAYQSLCFSISVSLYDCLSASSVSVQFH